MSTSTLPRFGIFQTEARIIHSECVNQDYEVGVWLPFSYGTSDRTYPLLYVPDGEIEQFSDLRYRDFLPQCDLPPEKDSRLAQYIHFYQQELFPLIEREYRVSAEDRAIFGFSAGGMFALQMMLTQPGMFRRHVVASCYWSVDYLRECLQQYAQQPNRPPADLFLSVGGQEEGMLPGYHSIIETLQNGQYPEVRLNTEIIAGEDHSASVIARTFLDGTRAVFKA